ncbi:MAG TPA: amidase [Candidatus Binataceae bacterium]|jgi:amidase|nr:amidase [Candidatus Binataceae bacterium]
MSGNELVWLDATAQAELVAKGAISAAELVEAAIERIERLNPQLNCVIYPRYDKARADTREFARRATAPLGGVPFLMKDLNQTIAGEPFSWGWKPLREAALTAGGTTYVAAKFLDAGLVALGQTTAPEWGATLSTESRAWGATRNPWDPGRSAGGSSGGAAVAVASGMVPIAHGNDAGGSVRIPASFCGLVGLKPSRGRTSLGPDHGEFWHGLCEEGALVRSVRDAAAALDVIQGYMPGDPWTAPPPARPYRDEVGRAPGRLRIGFMDRAPNYHPGLHPECAAAVRAAARLLEALGHAVEANFPAALDDPRINSAFGKVVAGGEAKLAAECEKLLARALGPDDFEEWTWFLVERGRRMSAASYLLACEWFNEFSRAVAGWWAGGFDVLVTPTLAQPAPPLGIFKLRAGEEPRAIGKRLNEVSPFTPPWNIAGLPALSLPLHMTADGLPVGVQFVAAYGREDLLIRLAAQLEQAAPWADRRPRVHA